MYKNYHCHFISLSITLKLPICDALKILGRNVVQNSDLRRMFYCAIALYYVEGTFKSKFSC